MRLHMSMMFAALVLLTIVKNSLCLTGKICQDKTAGTIAYCCAHTENQDGVCTECKIGFYSDGYDDRCKVCPSGRFGIKCIERCDCNLSSICDNVYGCSVKKTTVLATTMNQESGQNTNHKNNVTDSVVGTLISNRELLVYCIAAACLLLVMGACFLFNKYRLKSQRKHLEILQRRDIQTNSDSDNRSMQSRGVEGIYHMIDETQMCDLAKEPEIQNVYLEVINGSSESESSGCQTVNSNEYIYPYHSLLEKSDTHQYEQATATNDSIIDTISSDSSSPLPDTDEQGYLHMYQQLKPPTKYSGQTFVVTATINMTNVSSLDFDQHSKGVNSNSYQLLRHADIQKNTCVVPLSTDTTTNNIPSADSKSKPTAKSDFTLPGEHRGTSCQLDHDLRTYFVRSPSRVDRSQTL